MMRVVVALLVAIAVAIATAAGATTYYVDPGSGVNTNAGTSASAPWKTPPGTRNTADTAYLNTAWGAITTSAKLSCGDVILLKGGATQTSTQGGAWCIASGAGCAATGSYYPTTCTGANPITIRVATSAEWVGSTGPFTINQAGINPADSASFNYAGIVTISHVSGIVLKGASTSQRLVFTGAMTADSNNDVSIEMDGSIAGITVQYVDETNSLGAGIAMGDISDSLVSDAVRMWKLLAILRLAGIAHGLRVPAVVSAAREACTELERVLKQPVTAGPAFREA